MESFLNGNSTYKLLPQAIGFSIATGRLKIIERDEGNSELYNSEIPEVEEVSEEDREEDCSSGTKGLISNKRRKSTGQYTPPPMIVSNTAMPLIVNIAAALIIETPEIHPWS